MNKEIIVSKKLKIVFFGTPSFGIPVLEMLINNPKIEVLLVVTSPGECAIKEYSDRLNLPILQPPTTDDPQLKQELVKLNPDLGIVVAYKILPPSVYEIPKLGTFNIHASLLPNYRGAAPINWAIINGENRTGLTSFWLDRGIDTGNIICQFYCTISLSDTFESLYIRLSDLSASLCKETIRRILCGRGRGIEQKLTGNEKKAPKINREDRWIDWGMSSMEVRNFIRGINGALSLVFGIECKILEVVIFGIPKPSDVEPGTETIIENNRLLIKTGSGWVEILRLWKAGGKGPISGKDFVNGIKSQKRG